MILSIGFSILFFYHLDMGLEGWFVQVKEGLWVKVILSLEEEEQSFQ